MPTTTELFNNELHKLMARRDSLGVDLNSTERHLAGQLALLTTVLITATIIILGPIAEKTTHLALATKILIIVGFVFLVTSVFAGIVNYFEIMKHFNKWIDVKDEIARKISFHEYASIDDLRQDMVDKQTALPASSSRIFLYIQIATLAVSFSIYIALVTIFVFSTT